MKSEDVKKVELIVIESLPDNETKTGFNLYSSTIKYKLFQEPNLNSEFYDINNKYEMFSLLKKLVHKAVSENHFFFLHFEVHGYDDGIHLKNNEKINWGEMIPYFRKINVHFDNLLSLYFAVCKSANIVKYIEPQERAPFRFIVTTTKNMSVSHLIAGFEKFYDHFFFSFDADESVKEYNSIITNPKDELYLISSDYCFDMISDFERETADKKGLIKIYKEGLLKRHRYFKYFTDEQLEKIAERELIKEFAELKKKEGYFKMMDLRK